jgi:hypothetical protein
VTIRSADLQQAATQGPPITIIQNAVTVRIAETFKRDPGISGAATVEVIFPGGLRKGTWVETAPWVVQPDVGDEVLLFLAPHRTISTAYVPMWIGNGAFILQGDKVVTRGKSDLSLLLQKLPREEVFQRVRGGGLWHQ